MPRIVPAIGCLKKHLEIFRSTPEHYRPPSCPACGLAGLWCHGHYARKSAREGGELNPIPIPRYLCGKTQGCGKTCSLLPSGIAPRRWYLWAVQQAVLVALLAGNSIRTGAATCGRARRTVRRWWRWLQARHEQFAFYLRSRWPEWGRTEEWRPFWSRAIAECSLGELMAYLDGQGLIVP